MLLVTVLSLSTYIRHTYTYLHLFIYLIPWLAMLLAAAMLLVTVLRGRRVAPALAPLPAPLLLSAVRPCHSEQTET
jgi:hypothetical protein